jgi:hypothetical protein
MTTRDQRARLIAWERVELEFSEPECARLWAVMYPQKRRAMPADFPAAVQRCLRAYLEMAQIPSRGELNIAAGALYRAVMKAIEAGDAEAAARALERMPPGLRAELDRLTPGGIPSPAQIRDPQQGLERAKELLGCWIAGGKIVPGRKRRNGRGSRPTLELAHRFQQRPGFPRQEAEMLLVRSLAECWRSWNGGRFPRSWAHDGSAARSPFERQIPELLRGCGVSGVNALKLVRRALDEIRRAELGED